jgi:ElaB/YqjD/DUF883 family membrane-anchored ribosome-binding protein
MADETRPEERDGEAEHRHQDGDGAALGSIEHGARAAVDRAAQKLRGLRRAGGDWGKDAEKRAAEIGNAVRDQSGRAAGEVARLVEENPFVSLAIAFAVGFLCGQLRRR